MSRIVGILGGMGPVASASFIQRLLELTGATQDSDHIPIVLYADPRMRIAEAVTGAAPSPVPAMLKGIRVLEAAKPQLLAIVCNTAHLWYDELQAETTVPIVSILAAVVDALQQQGVSTGKRIGVLAAAGAIQSKLFDTYLLANGYSCTIPPQDVLEQQVFPGITAVRAGELPKAVQMFSSAVQYLIQQQQCDAVVFGCTEIGVALSIAKLSELKFAVPCVDSSEALAQAVYARWKALS
eukprot:TRINITY_DN13064_c0_g1_i1.p1 TRINITY_DN13064_c0_g1~~TRINITY_DN13064_c0_g1_i1.p1  ORF type:complete len:255 (-),score=70.54 TRINITY_DN13064_c0_g1_i1:32-748(-)